MVLCFIYVCNHQSLWESSVGFVYGPCTWPCTSRVHDHVWDVYTAVYTRAVSMAVYAARWKHHKSENQKKLLHLYIGILLGNITSSDFCCFIAYHAHIVVVIAEWRPNSGDVCFACFPGPSACTIFTCLYVYLLCSALTALVGWHKGHMTFKTCLCYCSQVLY